MSSPVTVRRACADDLPQVAAIADAVAEAPAWIEAMYRDYVGGGAEKSLRAKAMFVAQADGNLCGFAAVTAVAGQAELESVAVAEPMRRCGVGRALLAEVLLWARAQGVSVLELEVRAENRRAHAFYGSHGFRTIGRRARYYKDPVDDALLMRLELHEN